MIGKCLKTAKEIGVNRTWAKVRGTGNYCHSESGIASIRERKLIQVKSNGQKHQNKRYP